MKKIILAVIATVCLASCNMMCEPFVPTPGRQTIMPRLEQAGYQIDTLDMYNGKIDLAIRVQVNEKEVDTYNFFNDGSWYRLTITDLGDRFYISEGEYTPNEVRYHINEIVMKE